MSYLNEIVGGMRKCVPKVKRTGFDTECYMEVDVLFERFYRTLFKTHSKRMLWTFYQALLILLLSLHPCSAHIWDAPGCHKVGHIREERIANCVVFNITLNVCRGFCESFAVPSPSRTLRMNSNHLITSRAECCNIRDTHDVKAVVKCFEETGDVVYRELIYKSAESCSCSICKK